MSEEREEAARSAAARTVGEISLAKTPEGIDRHARYQARRARREVSAIEDAPYVLATLAGTWANVSGYAPARYATRGGAVHLSGRVSSGTGTIFTLPTGSRPKYRLSFTAAADGALAQVDVLTTGEVTVVTPSTAPTWLSLDGLVFAAEQ